MPHVSLSLLLVPHLLQERTYHFTKPTYLTAFVSRLHLLAPSTRRNASGGRHEDRHQMQRSR